MVGHFCYESGEHLATYTCEKIELQAMRCYQIVVISGINPLPKEVKEDHRFYLSAADNVKSPRSRSIFVVDNGLGHRFNWVKIALDGKVSLIETEALDKEGIGYWMAKVLHCVPFLPASEGKRIRELSAFDDDFRYLKSAMEALDRINETAFDRLLNWAFPARSEQQEQSLKVTLRNAAETIAAKERSGFLSRYKDLFNRYGVDLPISVPPTKTDLESPEYVLSYLSSIHALQTALPEDHDEWHTEHFTPAFSGLYSAAQIGLDDPFMDGRDCIMRMTTRMACISLFSDGVRSAAKRMLESVADSRGWHNSLEENYLDALIPMLKRVIEGDKITLADVEDLDKTLISNGLMV